MPPHDLSLGRGWVGGGTGFGRFDADAEAGGKDSTLPLHKASGCAVRRTGFGRVVRDAADAWSISLLLKWHSNCDVSHEADCDKETKDSGREKLHSRCDSVSAGTTNTVRCMSIARRIWRAVENSQESEAFNVLKKFFDSRQPYSPIVVRP